MWTHSTFDVKTAQCDSYFRLTETLNVLSSVVNFLKCSVTEVVFFSLVAFKKLDISQGNGAIVLL